MSSCARVPPHADAEHLDAASTYREPEKESHRAIRALRVSSAGNRALIRAKDEQQLYEHICEAITEPGGYSLAWIGIAENDSRKSVRIAASSGSGAEYLKTIAVTWGDEPLGHGPVGECIRSGHVVVLNDAAHDPRFLPWREQAAKYGFQSVAALPLRCEGVLIGALAIYSAESNAFYPEEISLLEELAEDVSYGMESRAISRRHARAEAAVLEAATEFRTIFDSTNDAIFIAAFDGRFLEVNQAACRSLGYSREHLLAMKIEDIDTPESGALLPGRLETIRQHGSACFESVQLRKDGTPVPVELNVRAIRYRDTPAVLGVGRDISERKKSEIELKARTAEMARLSVEAQKGSRAKSEFLANVSHEIRTPLNGILGFTNLLSETELSTEQREYNQAVCSSAKHLLALINGLLDYSRIEAGRLQLERVQFCVRECVEEAVNALRPLAEAKGLQIQAAFSEAVPEWAHGDPNSMRQVLVNLVGNAIKFTGQGSVEVRVSVIDDSGSACNPGGLALQFAVSDTGIGIPDAHKDVIFEPFRQADGSITRRFGGTGLGLTISSRLVALMNGRMWLDTREGLGSTFYFSVPLMPVAAPDFLSRDVRCNPAGTATRGLSILVGEDNALNQRLIRRLLELRRHRVTICETGEAVLRSRHTAHFDLILMDVHMPEMDGLEATRRIRSEERSTGLHIPIVAITASAMAQDRENCMQAGFDAYLSKPLDVQELDHMLARYASQLT